MSIEHIPGHQAQSFACLRREHRHCVDAECTCAHHAQDTEARFIRLAVGIGDLGAAADLVEQRIREAEVLLASMRTTA